MTSAPDTLDDTFRSASEQQARHSARTVRASHGTRRNNREDHSAKASAQIPDRSGCRCLLPCRGPDDLQQSAIHCAHARGAETPVHPRSSGRLVGNSARTSAQAEVTDEEGRSVVAPVCKRAATSEAQRAHLRLVRVPSLRQPRERARLDEVSPLVGRTCGHVARPCRARC